MFQEGKERSLKPRRLCSNPSPVNSRNLFLCLQNGIECLLREMLWELHEIMWTKWHSNSHSVLLVAFTVYKHFPKQCFRNDNPVASVHQTSLFLVYRQEKWGSEALRAEEKDGRELTSNEQTWWPDLQQAMLLSPPLMLTSTPGNRLSQLQFAARYLRLREANSTEGHIAS